jgi:hypothetical protein
LGETATNPKVCQRFCWLADDGGQRRRFPKRKIFDTVGQRSGDIRRRDNQTGWTFVMGGCVG